MEIDESPLTPLPPGWTWHTGGALASLLNPTEFTLHLATGPTTGSYVQITFFDEAWIIQGRASVDGERGISITDAEVGLPSGLPALYGLIGLLEAAIRELRAQSRDLADGGPLALVAALSSPQQGSPAHIMGQPIPRFDPHIRRTRGPADAADEGPVRLIRDLTAALLAAKFPDDDELADLQRIAEYLPAQPDLSFYAGLLMAAKQPERVKEWIALDPERSACLKASR